MSQYFQRFIFTQYIIRKSLLWLLLCGLGEFEEDITKLNWEQKQKNKTFIMLWQKAHKTTKKKVDLKRWVDLTLFLSQICGHAVLYRKGNQAKKVNKNQKYQI